MSVEICQASVKREKKKKTKKQSHSRISKNCGKITKDVTAAINRIRNYAAPKNCVRLHKNTPCATLGHCVNCNSDDCICNTTVISHHPTSKQDHVYIIIINEELGY